MTIMRRDPEIIAIFYLRSTLVVSLVTLTSRAADHSDDRHLYAFSPVSMTSLKIIVMSVYRTTNNGTQEIHFFEAVAPSTSIIHRRLSSAACNDNESDLLE